MSKDKEAVDSKPESKEVKDKFVRLADGVPGGVLSGKAMAFKPGEKYLASNFADKFLSILVQRGIVVFCD